MSNISFQDGVVFYECSANELIDVEIEKISRRILVTSVVS